MATEAVRDTTKVAVEKLQLLLQKSINSNLQK